MKNSTVLLFLSFITLIADFITHDKVTLIGIFIFTAAYFIVKQLEENDLHKN